MSSAEFLMASMYSLAFKEKHLDGWNHKGGPKDPDPWRKNLNGNGKVKEMPKEIESILSESNNDQGVGGRNFELEKGLPKGSQFTDQDLENMGFEDVKDNPDLLKRWSRLQGNIYGSSTRGSTVPRFVRGVDVINQGATMNAMDRVMDEPVSRVSVASPTFPTKESQEQSGSKSQSSQKKSGPISTLLRVLGVGAMVAGGAKVASDNGAFGQQAEQFSQGIIVDTSFNKGEDPNVIKTETPPPATQEVITTPGFLPTKEYSSPTPEFTATPDVMKGQLAKLTPEQRSVVMKAEGLNFDEDLGEFTAEVDGIKSRYDLGDVEKYGVENGWVYQDAIAVSGEKTLIVEHNPYDTSHSERLDTFTKLEVVDQAGVQALADMNADLLQGQTGGSNILRLKLTGADIGTVSNPDPEFLALVTDGDRIAIAVKKEKVGNQFVVEVNNFNMILREDSRTRSIYTALAHAIIENARPDAYFTVGATQTPWSEYKIGDFRNTTFKTQK